MAVSRKVVQRAILLRASAEIIRTASLADQLQNMGWESSEDIIEPMEEVQRITGQLRAKIRSSRLAATVYGESREERIQKAM